MGYLCPCVELARDCHACRRVRGDAYYELLDEFLTAVRQVCCVHAAFEMHYHYGQVCCVHAAFIMLIYGQVCCVHTAFRVLHYS